MIDKSVENYIKFNEGLRLKPYRTKTGYLIIGYSRKIEEKGISSHEANYLLTSDIIKIAEYLREILPGFEAFSINQKTALIDMTYTLGPKIEGFKKMIAALNMCEFEKAAAEVVQSLYFIQMPNRATKNAALIRG